MYTLSDISLSYELLDIKKNKNILDNIIYMGLTDSLDKVFNKKQKEPVKLYRLFHFNKTN